MALPNIFRDLKLLGRLRGKTSQYWGRKVRLRIRTVLILEAPYTIEGHWVLIISSFKIFQAKILWIRILEVWLPLLSLLREILKLLFKKDSGSAIHFPNMSPGRNGIAFFLCKGLFVPDPSTLRMSLYS